MKENIKVHGQLKGYLSWPLLLSVFMVCANIAAGCVSRIGGLVMIPFTISYLGVAMWIFFYSKKRILGGLFCGICMDSEAAAYRTGPALRTGR